MRQTFDGGDPVALMHDGEGQAGIHAASVDVHGASAALAVVASFLGAEQVQAFAQRIEQRDSRLELEAILAAVDVEHDRHRRDASGGRGCEVRERFRPAPPKWYGGEARWRLQFLRRSSGSGTNAA